MSIIENIHNQEIYGVARLCKLYKEFTRQTVFNTSRKYCVKPSCGGSVLGGLRKETHLNDEVLRKIISKFYDSEDEIHGNVPVGELVYYKAVNQKYYKTRAAQYFSLIKRHLIDLDKKDTSHECVWCFFPMYWTEKKHVVHGELSVFVLWFRTPKKKTAKIFHLKSRCYNASP